MQPIRPHREPEVLRDLNTAVRRGRNVAMLAAAGSGHERLFGAAIVSACQAGGGLQAVVLTPSRDAALRVAAGMADELRDADLDVLVWPAVPAADDPRVSDVVIARPITLLREIRGGRLRTADLKAICIDGADHAVRLAEWPAAQALLDGIATDTQVIVASGSFEGELADLLDRRLARPKRWPEELFAGASPADRSGDRLWYGAAARAEERIDQLAAALAGASSDNESAASAVVCATEEDARLVRAGLRARGLGVSRSTDAPERSAAIVVLTEPNLVDRPLGAVARWGPPDDLAAYAALPAGARRIAIVEPLHVQQLRLLASRAGWKVEPLADGPPIELDGVERFRDAVRKRLSAGDLSAELLVLQPLLEAHAAAEVAGALAALLRERAGEPASERRRESSSVDRPPAQPVLPAWTKIFVNIGKRDGAGPGDIVGAITGETGAAGGQIGLIDLRPSFTLVDVDAEIADQVIDGLSGAQIKGRTVSARRAKEAV